MRYSSAKVTSKLTWGNGTIVLPEECTMLLTVNEDLTMLWQTLSQPGGCSSVPDLKVALIRGRDQPDRCGCTIEFNNQSTKALFLVQ